MGKKISLPVVGPSSADHVDQSQPAGDVSRESGATVLEEIDHEVKSNPIMLYMKGTPQQPMCGFSARAVHILEQLGRPYRTVDILQDPEKRQAIKEYGEWPTIPQLYVNGELLGGSDILVEMFQSGELKKLVEETFASA